MKRCQYCKLEIRDLTYFELPRGIIIDESLRPLIEEIKKKEQLLFRPSNRYLHNACYRLIKKNLEKSCDKNKE